MATLTTQVPINDTVADAMNTKSNKPLNPYTHDEYGLKYDPTVPPSERYAGDNGVQATDSIPYWIRFTCGALLTGNFVVFWAAAVFLCGFTWHTIFKPFLQPIYNYMDQHPKIRGFAEKYIYTNPRHADYFVQSILVLMSWVPAICLMFYWQITQGCLHWWQIYFYTFQWVGMRGGVLGGVYSISHREGHNPMFYKPWIRKWIGNIFEEVFSPFFGSVPKNFAITHMYLHHALQARSADSFYQYDVDRSSLKDFMILLFRIGMHCAGFTAYNQMRIHGLKKQANRFLKGMVQYYFIYPAIILAITKSWSFLFWIYFQPFVGMTFFLCFMNVAFHAFIEYDEDGSPVECVFSTDMIETNDDYFGEDSHLSHHVAGHVYWRDLDENRKKMYKDFAKYHASIFRGIGVAEVAGLMLANQWETLADHFVQFNDAPAPNKLPEDELIRLGSVDLSNDVKQSVWVGQGLLTKKEVVAMLKTRAKRREPKWLRATLLFCETAKTSWVGGADDEAATPAATIQPQKVPKKLD